MAKTTPKRDAATKPAELAKKAIAKKSAQTLSKAKKPPVATEPIKPKKEPKTKEERELTVLRPSGAPMTEKRLKTLLNKTGVARFSIWYSLQELIAATPESILADVAKRACPPGYSPNGLTYKINDRRRDNILLEMSASILPLVVVPPPPQEPLPVEEYRDTSKEAEDASRLASHVVVHAKAHTDDYVHEVEFDAAPWFAKATDNDILILADEGFEFDTKSDEVALFCKERDPKLKTMFDYLDTIRDVPSKKDVNGFGCVVDQIQALSWVEKHRPHLMERLADIEDAKNALDDPEPPSGPEGL